MANVLTTNPVIITAAMGSSYKSSIASVLGLFQTLLIEKWFWETPANVGDQVTVTDGSGTILLTLTCEVAGQSQIIDWNAKPKLFKDFQVTGISSGALYIYLR